MGWPPSVSRWDRMASPPGALSQVCAVNAQAGAVRVHEAELCKLLLLDRRIREICFTRADEPATQASHINRFDHGVRGHLVLEAVIEVLRIRRSEMWIRGVGEGNLRRLKSADQAARCKRKWVRKAT